MGRVLARCVDNMLARGVVAASGAVTKMQTLQVRLKSTELKDGVEHFEPYGFTSRPLPGAEVLAGFFGGDRSHGVVICAADRRYRIREMAEGEVAIYTDEGDSIVLKRGRLIEVTTHTLRINATELVEFNTQQFTVNASVKASFTTPLAEYSQQVKVLGLLTGQGGMAISGGSGASFSGSISQTGGSFTTDQDVSAGSISLKNHRHAGGALPS
jgi:phage baseplate assembly protein V